LKYVDANKTLHFHKSNERFLYNKSCINKMSAFTLLFVENTWEITVAHLQSWHSREKRINEHQLFTVFRKSFLRYVT